MDVKLRASPLPLLPVWRKETFLLPSACPIFVAPRLYSEQILPDLNKVCLNSVIMTPIILYLLFSVGLRPFIQLEEDAQQAQADAQPQPTDGRVPAVPQEVHQERLPQSPYGECPWGNGELEPIKEALAKNEILFFR